MKSITVVFLCILSCLVQNALGQYPVGLNAAKGRPNSRSYTRCPLGYTYNDITPGSLPAVPPNPLSKCPLGYTWADVPAALSAAQNSAINSSPGYNAPNSPSVDVPSRVPNSLNKFPLGYNNGNSLSKCPLGYNAENFPASRTPNTQSKCPLGYTWADIPAGSLPTVPPNPLSRCPLGYTWADVPAALESSTRSTNYREFNNAPSIPSTPNSASSMLGKYPSGSSVSAFNARVPSASVPSRNSQYSY